MSVLSNLEIRVAIAGGDLIVTPPPAIPPGVPGTTYDEASLTVHLGDHVHVPKDNCQVAFDLGMEGNIRETLDAALHQVRIPRDGWVLQPDSFVLATVHEHLSLPIPKDRKGGLMGRIEGRSKYARLGLLVHATAPTIQPGFSGHLTFELKNLGYFPIILRPRSPIGQIIVERVDGEIVADSGDFDSQLTATGNGEAYE